MVDHKVRVKIPVSIVECDSMRGHLLLVDFDPSVAVFIQDAHELPAVIAIGIEVDHVLHLP